MNYQSAIHSWFGSSVIAAATEHAREQYPHESCGFVARGQYFPCVNRADNRSQNFVISDARFDQAVVGGTLEAIVHSHPGGPIFPSETDMRQQAATNVPWLIVPIYEEGVQSLIAWGDQLPVMPIIGRPFVHAIFDCYATIRDCYRLGRQQLAEQGIEWPLDPIELPEVPRNDQWWSDGQDLYLDHFRKFGFEEITRSEARAGDVFLMKLGDARGNPKQRINHGGLLVESGKQHFVLHHLPKRLSRREPAAIWGRAADMWIRYTGEVS